MCKIHNLIHAFNREIEVLDVDDEGMVYVIDQKSDSGNLCSIGRYHWETHMTENLLSLEGTRLYESFRTYGAMDKYFYAVTIRSDYKLRLEKIDKSTWNRLETFYLVPEGEILNIYPVNEEYLIVTDEVAATDEILYRFNDEDYRGKYYTLNYLYHLKTGEKWYLQDAIVPYSISDIKSVSENDSSRILRVCLQRDGQRDEQWTITDQKLIQALRQGGQPVFEKSVMSQTGMAFEMTETEDKIQITHLQNDALSFSYDKAYGEFSGIYAGDMAVTGFYKPEMLKEDLIFREYTAIHHIRENRVEVFEGTCQQMGNHLILLRSFMCL